MFRSTPSTTAPSLSFGSFGYQNIPMKKDTSKSIPMAELLEGFPDLSLPSLVDFSLLGVGPLRVGGLYSIYRRP